MAFSLLISAFSNHFQTFAFLGFELCFFLPIFAAKKTRKIFAFFCLKVCLFLPSKSVLKKSLNSLPAKARIALKLQNRCRQRQGLPGASIFVARFAGKEAKAGKVSLLLLLPFFAFAMPNPVWKWNALFVAKYAVNRHTWSGSHQRPDDHQSCLKAAFRMKIMFFIGLLVLAFSDV